MNARILENLNSDLQLLPNGFGAEYYSESLAPKNVERRLPKSSSNWQIIIKNSSFRYIYKIWEYHGNIPVILMFS